MSAPQLDKGLIDFAVLSTGSSECEGCGNQSNDLREFKPFIGMKVVLVEGQRSLAPHYGAPVMLCYPCFKLAVKIDIRKS